MDEWHIIWYIPLCSLLFALGGTGMGWFPNKLLRNPGIGIATGLYLFAQGMVFWPMAVLHGIGQFLANKIAPSYGDKMKNKVGPVWIWPMRWLTFTIWLVPTLWIGFSWMVIFVPPILVGFMWMSQNGQPSKFVHKIWELLCGFGIAATYVAIYH